jgi:hypothetical protein
VEVKVQLEPQELQEPMVLRGQLAYLELTERQAQLAYREMWDQQEQLEFQGMMEQQGQQAFKVMLVLLAQQVLRADKAQQELLGLLVPMGLQEAQVQQD